MTAIQATSRTVKTMSDGTLRLTVDIEPRHAQEAFQLFGMPDMPVVLARLTQQAAQEQAQAETIADEQKGGALAKLAGMWCRQADFLLFLESMGRGTGNGETSDEYVREICGIDSRAELDHNPEAARIFNERIRQPYMAWLQGV